MRTRNMRKMMRSTVVALLVALMTFSPATACRFCGGGYRGGYGAGYGGGCQPVYYESYDRSPCCGSEIVVSEGCGDCGACDACDGCAGCGEMTPMSAPEPPAPVPQRTPATVNRMPMQPAPSLPPHAMPPAKPKVETPVTPVAPPQTITPPPAETPAAKPAETLDDLFGAPADEPTPLPAEEPATPAETDDFFFDAPAEEPAGEPSSQPSDEDLFGPPADEKTPADEQMPAEESNDDLFGSTEAILGLPGGLAGRGLRRWVDDSGSFSCQGRMLRTIGGKVQLLKENGRTTTVPLSRLSQADLEFVHRQASAQRADTFGKTAQASTGRTK